MHFFVFYLQASLTYHTIPFSTCQRPPPTKTTSLLQTTLLSNTSTIPFNTTSTIPPLLTTVAHNSYHQLHILHINYSLPTSSLPQPQISLHHTTRCSAQEHLLLNHPSHHPLPILPPQVFLPIQSYYTDLLLPPTSHKLTTAVMPSSTIASNRYLCRHVPHFYNFISPYCHTSLHTNPSSPLPFIITAFHTSTLCCILLPQPHSTPSVTFPVPPLKHHFKRQKHPAYNCTSSSTLLLTSAAIIFHFDIRYQSP